MGEIMLNPLAHLYNYIFEIVGNITVKISYYAEQNETLESKQYADGYLDALNKRDTFDTYISYTEEELREAGITNPDIIKEVTFHGDTSNIPRFLRNTLLEIKRRNIINNFNEKNNYYRMLNGKPNIEDKKYFYLSDILKEVYSTIEDIDIIPIHDIEDHYNNEIYDDIMPKLGSYLIKSIESSGYINELIEKNPDKEYLKYLGSNRISIEKARTSKNFEIIRIKEGKAPHSLYEKFTFLYSSARDYFMKCIFIHQYRNVMEYYDNFIGLCIMVMTILQVIARQPNYGYQRNFFDINAIKFLYEAYHIPFDLDLDQETQMGIVQNLNLLVQNKATNKVLYDITELLGFGNISIYKYYLSRKRILDGFGAPIVKYKERLNYSTGEMETVPDYETMYELFFQRQELKNDDFLESFRDPSNTIAYEDIVSNDPFWWTDTNLYRRVWESEYNFVESKYLSLAISYDMSSMIFDNVILFKMIMSEREHLSDLTLKLPKITLTNDDIPLFDSIILLMCLLCSKHNLYGDIITIPSQVSDVVDYMRNIEDPEYHFNTLAFNFDFYSKENIFGEEPKDFNKMIKDLKPLLSESDYEEFMEFVKAVTFENYGTDEEKTDVFNDVYSNIKRFYKWFVFQMTKAPNRKTYEALKNLYFTSFYSQELRDVFTIEDTRTVGEEASKRTAYSYFEYLHYLNPSLYECVYEVNYGNSYADYLDIHGLTIEELSFSEYLDRIENGEIEIDYSQMKNISYHDDGTDNKDELIYYYVNHILTRLELWIDDVSFMHILADVGSDILDLLMKLIRFFKSFTVDILSLDTILIFNLKPENLVKLYDEVAYMRKIIEPHDHIQLAYSDVIHTLDNYLHYQDNLFSIYDKCYRHALLTVDEKHTDVFPSSGNSIRLVDGFSPINKMLKFKNKHSALNLYDTLDLRWDEGPDVMEINAKSLLYRERSSEEQTPDEKEHEVPVIRDDETDPLLIN